MITLQNIENIVYDLCVEANTTLPEDVFTKILDAFNNEPNADAKQALQLVLNNAKLAYDKKMPLCQDTGQVLVFVKGKGKYFIEGFKDAINKGVEKAYKENFYRESVVKNALFNRKNTKTNTPCIIYTEISDFDGLAIELLIKGAGSENVSTMSMHSPTSKEEEIIDFVVSVVKKADAKACPPYFLGVGIGGTMEYAGFLSKKALLLDKNQDENHKKLAEKIKTAVNELGIGAAGLGGASTALDVKILTDFTHIACMPVAVTINCHSSRHAKAVLKAEDQESKRLKESKISDSPTHLAAYSPEKIDFSDFIHVDSSDTQKLKSLTAGQKVLLSGEIYTARDMAHKRLVEMIKNGEKLPFDLKNKIIFYAGPCPSSPSCVIGSVGPTTSARMDKYASIFYENGVLATIGKGERSQETKITANKVGGLYFTVIGGIACYLSGKVLEVVDIAFEDLGAEAIRKLVVKDLPLRLDF